MTDELNPGAGVEPMGEATAVVDAPAPETDDVQPYQAPTAELPTYDFTRSTRMAGDQLRALNAMHDVCAESLAAWMTAKLREVIRVYLADVQEATFVKIVRRLERPACTYLYDVRGPSELTAMVVVDPTVAFFCVDRLLGGTTEPAAPNRAMTELEQRVGRLVIERVREAVEDMWAEHTEFRTAFSAFESIPDLLDFADPNEPFLVSTFTVEGDGWSGTIEVSLPFALLEPALGQSEEADGTATASGDKDALKRHLLKARVTVDARLPAFTVTLGELQDLRPGTVLNTRIPTTAPVELSVCGQTRFTAVAGRKGQELAVRVLEPTDGASR